MDISLSVTEKSPQEEVLTLLGSCPYLLVTIPLENTQQAGQPVESANLTFNLEVGGGVDMDGPAVAQVLEMIARTLRGGTEV